MQINPHLNFNGQCEAAFRFYEECLGGKVVVMMTWGESPMADETPAHWREKILHTTLAFDDCRLTGCDVLPDSYEKPQGFSVFLRINNPDDAERIFNKLAQSGSVQVPMQQTFWAPRFGMMVDQFGIPWLIQCARTA